MEPFPRIWDRQSLIPGSVNYYYHHYTRGIPPRLQRLLPLFPEPGRRQTRVVHLRYQCQEVKRSETQKAGNDCQRKKKTRPEPARQLRRKRRRRRRRRVCAALRSRVCRALLPRSLTHFPGGDQPSAPGIAGSTMDEYKGMTDKELIARLKKYSIPHGPLVGSTRKLYEKKIYEYETERTQYPSPGGSHTEPATSQSYVKETFVSPRKREDFNYGREALGSTRTNFKEYVPTRQEYYSEYRDEDPSPTKSYLSYNYNLPHHEEHSSYASEDMDVNTSEPSRSSYRSYSSLLSHTTSPGTVSARQPIAQPYPYSSSEKDMSTERDSSSSYQSVFQRKSSGLSSLQVQPRRAIHPERQAQAAEKALESNAETKRYLPLWLQLLVFGLLAAFLVFIYFLEGGADGNPFVKYISQ